MNKGELIVISKQQKSNIPYQSNNLFIYIGRGSALGNQFTSIQGRQTKAKEVCCSREESISKYKVWLMDQLKSKIKLVVDAMNTIWQMAKRGFKVYLVCYCKPKSCHGDIIKEIINSKL